MTNREKTPNHRLAALMREAGISNKSLARRMRDISRADDGEEITPSHTNVDKWLSGETRRPKDRTCHVVAKALASVLGRPVSLADVGYGEVPVEGIDSTLRYPETISDSATALTSLTGYDLDSTQRRSKLQVVPEAWAALLVKALYGSDTDAASTSSASGPLSAFDVQAIRDATAMFSTYDYRYGGGRPKPLVAKYLESEVVPQLPRISASDPLRSEYFREAAALTRLAGWTAYDIGEQGLAQRYLYNAFRLARAAGDKPLCGRILAGMSHQANFLGHYEHAVHLARAAAHGAAGYASATTMSLFHAMEARALASQGNEVETTTALTTAERWMEQSEPQNDPPWIAYFDRAELHAEFAHCFRDIGKPERANSHATASIAESDSVYVRSLSFCRTVLATAYLQSGELDEALAVGKGVVDTAGHLRSYRVLSYIEEFRGKLTSHAEEPRVWEFEDYLREQIPLMWSPSTRRLNVA